MEKEWFSLVFIILAAIATPALLGGRGIGTGAGSLIVIAAVAVAGFIGWLIDNKRSQRR